MSENKDYIVPGEYRLAEGELELNAGREKTKIRVSNTGDRPIQIGSHIHFIEVNKYLEFDRKQAIGKRLNIPAGTSVRVEPGEETEVELVELAGRRRIYGISNMTNGSVDNVDEIMKNLDKFTTKGGE